VHVEQRRDLIGGCVVREERVERIRFVGDPEPDDPRLRPGMTAGVDARRPDRRTTRAGEQGGERRGDECAQRQARAVMARVFASCGAIAS
jgi:hypothetical protein